MKPELIKTEEEFIQIIETHKEFFLLKHSLTCPISASALQQYNHFVEQTELPCFVLNVQEARGVSNQIAEQTGIRHESPQVIQFVEGEAIWHDSHSAITADRLKSL
ncbi:bacillithiol system protein YtxJ [Halobacillus dabanensis]|uniref:Bacillithiol system protein YtxJ n=1 Tax=Halobacillus dabanensis TaxID=240302 RepID=A0A1I3NPM8_HALDA|nr:bacillithiol system redox-active protein YtxJ [Halobacillus dabanensis]SFJ11097.1 bacillithiol system protein YtxJ [Halobacillus dabanensis]